MRQTDELCQKLFEEIFRDKLRRALEDDAPAIQELKILAQRINDVLNAKSYYDGNREHAVGTIYLRSGIMKIEDYAFANCKQLEKIILPDGLKEIGAWAFFGCSGLREINIPDSLIVTGSWVFDECNNLKKISYHRKTEPLLKKNFRRTLA